MIKYKFGDVVLALFNQTAGKRKQRPALVISDVEREKKESNLSFFPSRGANIGKYLAALPRDSTSIARSDKKPSPLAAGNLYFGYW